MYTDKFSNTSKINKSQPTVYSISLPSSYVLRLLLISGLLFVIFLFSVNAQTSGKVSGKLLALNNNQPVEFATVAVYNLPDSSLVKGVISDNTGSFAINGLSKGKYFLKVSYMGYKPVIRDSVNVSDIQPEYFAGNIALEEDVKSIKEVTIEGERLKGTAEVDKIVYAVTPKAASVSHSGLELLRQVPAVQVDFQNNLTLEGSSNVMILVDGKQRDKEYLAQLDPSSIDKVEVMTNPSSKYDAAIDGVINIILKKDGRLGYSARIEAEIPLGNRFSNSSANVEVGFGPIRVYGSAQLHAEKFDITTNLLRKAQSGTNSSVYSQNGDGVGAWTYLGLTYGVDLFINKNNTLSFYANYRPESGGKMNFTLNNELTQNGAFSNYNISGTVDNDLNESEYYSIFYKHNFAKPSQEFTLDVNYNIYTNTSDNLYTEQYYLSDRTIKTGDLINRKETGLTSKAAIGVKLDYTQPLGDKVKFNTGYNGYFQNLDNSMTRESDVAPEKFKYNEVRTAFYGNLSGAIKSFNWQTGLRYEVSFIEMNESTKTDYACLLPTFSLQQKLSKTKTLKFNYRRSIQRPGSGDLNPFVNNIDSVTISRGNPNLNPAYTNKFELNLTMQLGNNFITPGVYYSKFNNSFQQIKVVNASGVSESLTENIGDGFEYGLNFSGSVKITKKVQFNPYFAVFSKTLNDVDLYGIEGADKVSWRTNFSIVANITEKLTFFTFVQYNSPYINSQRTIKRDPIYAFGLERNVFKNNKGKVSLMIINPFMKKFSIENSVTESAGFWQEQDIQVDVQPLVTVKFSYAFNKGKEIKKMDRKREIEGDSKGSLF